MPLNFAPFLLQLVGKHPEQIFKTPSNLTKTSQLKENSSAAMKILHKYELLQKDVIFNPLKLQYYTTCPWRWK